MRPLVCVAWLAMSSPLLAQVPLDEPESRYAAVVAAGASACQGQAVNLAVDLAAAPNLETRYDEKTGQLSLRYRMMFNQVTEGWNWHPEAAQVGGDYYRYKFLPLHSREERRPSLYSRDTSGEMREIRVEWRYDYFFAFDNLAELVPRMAADDDGFVATATLDAPSAARLAGGDLALALKARLAPPCHSQSTTYWNPIHGRPLDFTLKKRYLLGRLEEVVFIDRANGRVLARHGRLGEEPNRAAAVER